MTINLWSEREHAVSYLERRAGYPRREEGYGALLELVPAGARRVLDLGCGDGEVAGRILAGGREVEIIAADFSAEMLRRARERFVDDARVTVVEHDLNRPLPESWGTFDAVVSAFAIHHVVDARKRVLFGEVFRALGAGGVFLDLEHVSSPTPELHDAFLHAFGLTTHEDDPSNQLASVEAQLEWLRELGFEQVDCHWKWRELARPAGGKPT